MKMNILLKWIISGSGAVVIAATAYQQAVVVLKGKIAVFITEKVGEPFLGDIGMGDILKIEAFFSQFFPRCSGCFFTAGDQLFEDLPVSSKDGVDVSYKT